jgi:hypothetical protein
MADANQESGWYLITHASRAPECWFRRRDGRWSPHRYHAFPADELPEGWTRGARIDDLLRDTERYRWLRAQRTYPFGSTDWDDLDVLIDAEITREKANG